MSGNNIWVKRELTSSRTNTVVIAMRILIVITALPLGIHSDNSHQDFINSGWNVAGVRFESYVIPMTVSTTGPY